MNGRSFGERMNCCALLGMKIKTVLILGRKQNVSCRKEMKTNQKRKKGARKVTAEEIKIYCGDC